jgi:hypothetical protein
MRSIKTNLGGEKDAEEENNKEENNQKEDKSEE